MAVLSGSGRWSTLHLSVQLRSPCCSWAGGSSLLLTSLAVKIWVRDTIKTEKTQFTVAWTCLLTRINWWKTKYSMFCTVSRTLKDMQVILHSDELFPTNFNALQSHLLYDSRLFGFKLIIMSCWLCGCLTINDSCLSQVSLFKKLYWSQWDYKIKVYLTCNILIMESKFSTLEHQLQ